MGAGGNNLLSTADLLCIAIVLNNCQPINYVKQNTFSLQIFKILAQIINQGVYYYIDKNDRTLISQTAWNPEA